MMNREQENIWQMVLDNNRTKAINNKAIIVIVTVSYPKQGSLVLSSHSLVGTSPNDTQKAINILDGTAMGGWQIHGFTKSHRNSKDFSKAAGGTFPFIPSQGSWRSCGPDVSSGGCCSCRSCGNACRGATRCSRSGCNWIAGPVRPSPLWWLNRRCLTTGKNRNLNTVDLLPSSNFLVFMLGALGICLTTQGICDQSAHFQHRVTTFTHGLRTLNDFQTIRDLSADALLATVFSEAPPQVDLAIDIQRLAKGIRRRMKATEAEVHTEQLVWPVDLFRSGRVHVRC